MASSPLALFHCRGAFPVPSFLSSQGYPLPDEGKAPFMVEAPLQHRQPLLLKCFCIFLLGHSEENKWYQARCLLIAQEGQPRVPLLPLSLLFTPHSPSLVLSEIRFPWSLFFQSESLCLHTFDKGTAISSLDCLPLSVRAPSYGRMCTKNLGILFNLFFEKSTFF